jgi:streptomycin 6-kinase
MQPLEPPEQLVRKITAWQGEAGRAWLATLPERAGGYLERWELSPQRVLTPGGQISMIVLVRQADGTPACLKLGMVTNETGQEHAALAHWGGRGAVRLLRRVPAEGVLLLERLSTDVSLRSLPEQKAMLEAAATLRRLWVKPPTEGHSFTSVADCTAGLVETLCERREQPWAADVRALIDEAVATRDRLLADPVGDRLLHGDFHHGNVLAGERAPWLAIDPKPLVGDPGYDLAWLALDRRDTLVASPRPQAAARRRIAELSASLEVAEERLRGWTLFRAVEAGVWALAVGDREFGELLLEFASWL